MKAVMLSIQPKYCELIASGKKTVEVRRTKPKVDLPFECYIYETKDKHFENIGVHYADGRKDFIHHIGKVIGEFVCDKIDVYPYDCHIGYPTPQYEGDDSFCDCGEGYWITYKEIEDSCLTQDELMEYGRGDTLYGWHITDLVIYDKPKELREFRKPCIEHDHDCKACWNEELFFENGMVMKTDCILKLTRPPQSWCYVEELKGEN